MKHLRKTAKDFLYNTKISDDEKINILFEWLDKLELIGQDSLALYDTDARLMKTKDKGQKYKKFAYNIQLATYTQTKLICGVNVVQHPTDHYQIPALLEQTIENIETLPGIVSADNIYATLANLFYLKEHGISARIPTRQQSKKIQYFHKFKFHFLQILNYEN